VISSVGASTCRGVMVVVADSQLPNSQLGYTVSSTPASVVSSGVEVLIEG